MKPLKLLALMIAVSSTAGCFSLGRDPAEQRAINEAYTARLKAEQGNANAGVGAKPSSENQPSR
jgi:hypothetical protein